MYENLVQQEASKELISDLKNNLMPSAMLFSGNDASGKLTAALETARILSCHETPRGKWTCECQACLQHKALVSQNLLLLGPRDCTLEIAASKKTFLLAVRTTASYIIAARYLFLRSVRKLTLRFNGILWEGDSNLNKIATIMEAINEKLELLDFPRELPEYAELEKICEDLEKNCQKLENEYLYDSIPVNQIRNMEAWAHIKSEEGKKTIIIEKADRMQTSVRNALLKVLEEPPEDCVFILLTSKKNAIMQTILSRVRTYNFRERSLDVQKEVIQRVFHNEQYNQDIASYMQTFLPVFPEQIAEQANQFYTAIAKRSIPDIAAIVKKCDNFYPRMELKLFLNDIAKCLKPMMQTQRGVEACAECMNKIRDCWENITMYNQTPTSALEILLREMRRCVDM